MRRASRLTETSGNAPAATALPCVGILAAGNRLSLAGRAVPAGPHLQLKPDGTMKKAVGLTTGVIVVLAAGWLGATWYTGKRIEAETPARLAEVNQKLADPFAGMGSGLEKIGRASRRGRVCKVV